MVLCERAVHLHVSWAAVVFSPFLCERVSMFGKWRLHLVVRAPGAASSLSCAGASQCLQRHASACLQLAVGPPSCACLCFHLSAAAICDCTRVGVNRYKQTVTNKQISKETFLRARGGCAQNNSYLPHKGQIGINYILKCYYDFQSDFTGIFV